MRLFDKRTPLQKEWEKLEVQEQRFLQKRSEKRESILNQKLEEKIPPKLQKTLDTAFAKAFALIFEKGTGVIEKTYQRTKLEQDYQVRQYMADVKQNSKSLRSFSKKARDTGTKNLLLSGVSGIGMGVLGIGLPDIPVFTGMILKNIYETALQYGYSYESREEKYFILLLIRGAVSYVKLGEIQAIDYSWGEIDFVTKPLNEMRLMECTECEMSAPGAYDIDIEADDINVTDTATVIWEIA